MSERKNQFTTESMRRLKAGAAKGGARSGGVEKHFTPESKQRHIEGARRGGLATCSVEFSGG